MWHIYWFEKKGLDTVNHAILLTKLNHHGIRGHVHEWFKSYLSYREQFMIVNGHDSISLPLNCGVPQRSIWGPLLFLLWLNDLPNTSSFLTFYRLVDDTIANLYLSSKILNHLEKILNGELKSVAEWLKSNRWTLSILKPIFIVFYSNELYLVGRWKFYNKIRI